LSDGLNAALVLIALSGAAGAGEPRCVPALPVFCANVHVGCSGKTRLPTRGFRVEAGRIVFDDGTDWRVTAAASDSGVVYRREASRDWIRIGREGRYSQRVYLERGPVMAFGECE